jgi:hypothetical protein
MDELTNQMFEELAAEVLQGYDAEEAAGSEG